MRVQVVVVAREWRRHGEQKVFALDCDAYYEWGPDYGRFCATRTSLDLGKKRSCCQIH